MNERERVRIFNRALDRLIADAEPSDLEDLTFEDQGTLRLARFLRDIDFSFESKDRETLSQRLLSMHSGGRLKSDQQESRMTGPWERAQSAWKWGLSALALFTFVIIMNWTLNSFVHRPAAPTESLSTPIIETEAKKTAKTNTPKPPQPEELGKIAYFSKGALWIQDLAGGAAIRLADGGSQPRWSPSGRWVAFRHNNEQVWIADTQSKLIVPLNEGQVVGSYDWKPGQDVLAYVAGENEIRLYDPMSNEEFLLVPHVENRRTLQLAWSPSGEQLAVHWFERTLEYPPYSAIWVITARGDLQPGEIYNGDPELLGWTNDGKSLLLWDGMLIGDGSAAFSASLRADGLPLVKVPLDSYQPEILADRVLPYKDYVQADPSSSDRLAIVVGAGREAWKDKTLSLYSDGQLEQLTALGGSVSSPAWSPDGRLVAFVSMPKPSQDLAGGEPARQALMERHLSVLELESRQVHPLTNDPVYRDEYPLWSKYGRYLLFARLDAANRASLWLIPLEGGQPDQVVENLDLGGDWFGYYGHIIWDDYFDWWQEPEPSSITPEPTSFPPQVPPTTFPPVQEISVQLPDLRLGRGRLQRFALSPRGDLVAVGSSLGVCMYDTITWQEVWCDQADPHAKGGVLSLEFDPRGERVSAGTWSGRVVVWNADSGERLWEMDLGLVNIRCLAWSPDSERLIAGADEGWFDVLDAHHGEVLKSLRAGWPSVLATAWSPDGSTFATGDFFGEVVIWEASSYQRIAAYKSPDGWNVNSLAWTLGGDLIAIGYAFEPGCGGCNPEFSGRIEFVDARSGALIRSLAVGSPVKDISLSPDGRTLAAGLWDALAIGEPGTAEVWLLDPDSGDLLTKLPGGRSDLGIDWFPTGDHLLVAGDQGHITVTSLSGEQTEHNLPGYEPLHAFTWSPDGKRIASSTDDGKVIFWDVTSGLDIDEIETGNVGDLLSWSPDGDLIAVTGDGIRIWDIQARKPIAQLSLADVTNPRYLQWSPDGNSLAASHGEGYLTIWDTTDWQEVLSIKVSETVNPIAWSPDGTQIAMGGSGQGTQQIVILDAATGETQRTFDTSGWVEALAWSRNNSLLATAGGGWAEVWNTSHGQRIFQKSGENVHSWGIQRVALSPDGRVLATGAGEVILWDINSGEEIGFLIGLSEGITEISFSPEGSYLAALSDDGVVTIWKIYR